MHSRGPYRHRRKLLTFLTMKLGNMLLRCKRRKIKGKEGSNEPDHWYQDSPRNEIGTMVGRNLDGDTAIQGELRKLGTGDRLGYVVKYRLE